MPAFRKQVWEAQGKRCKLCGQPLALADAVMDHNHTTGECRGVLHRGCNSMLGKIENHMRIAKLTSALALTQFLHGVVPYMHSDGLGVLYPTHRTEEDKRLRANKLARARRAAKKAQP